MGGIDKPPTSIILVTGLIRGSRIALAFANFFAMVPSVMVYAPADKAIYDKAVERNARLAEAADMARKGFTSASIAKHFGVAAPTVGRWFRTASFPSRRCFPRPGNGGPEDTATEAAADAMARHDVGGEDDDDILDDYSEHLVGALKRAASTAEDEAMAAVAEAQNTPADKYQHYIAAAGIKLIRDSMQHIRGPKTVRELSELDQLIRRNMGLGAKTPTGQSSMKIDISILNNGIADKGRGSISRMKKDAINADVVVPEEAE